MSDEKKLEDEMRESFQRIWLAGLGALSVAEEEGTKVFRRLVERGAAFRERHQGEWEDLGRRASEEAARARETAESTLSRLERALDEAVASRLRRSGVPTDADVSALAARIEELTRQVEELKARRTSGGKA